MKQLVLLPIIAVSLYGISPISARPPINTSDLTALKEHKYAVEALRQQTMKDMGLVADEIKMFDHQLQTHILETNANDIFDLMFILPSFDDETTIQEEWPKVSTGRARTVTGELIFTANGKEVPKREVEEINKQYKNAIAKQNERRQKLHLELLAQIHAYLKHNGIPSSLDNITHATGFFSAQLNKEQLKSFMKRYSKDISGVGLNAKLEYSFDDSIVDTQVQANIINNTGSDKGDGISIYVADELCPYQSIICYDSTSYYNIYHYNDFRYHVLDDSRSGATLKMPCETTYDYSQHTRIVTRLLRGFSPLSEIYCKSMQSEPLNEISLVTLFSYISSDMDIETYSLNSYFSNDSSCSKNDNGTYTALDHRMDNQVKNEQNAVFVSAGNSSKECNGFTYTFTHVLSPAKAFNVMTVGNANYKTYPLAINSESNYLNPSNGNEKPEIVAPGTLINFTDDEIAPQTGTSFSTPITAAIAADLMSDNISLKNHPMMLKALMLASRPDNVADRASLPSGESAIGAGGVRIDSAMDHTVFTRYWDSTTDSPYDVNFYNGEVTCDTSSQFYVPNTHTHTRIAMSWMIDGDYAIAHNGAIGTVHYFYVVDNNNVVVAKSWEGLPANDWIHDNWAVTEFDPSNTSSHYTLVVCKDNTLSDPGHTLVNIGLAITSE